VPVRIRCWVPEGASRPVVRAPAGPYILNARFGGAGDSTAESAASSPRHPSSCPSPMSLLEGTDTASEAGSEHPTVRSVTGDYTPRSPSMPPSPEPEIELLASSDGWLEVSDDATGAGH
jgi:hypothetical protein